MTWTADECAQAWGVRTPTFLGYVSRGQAPAALPDPGPDGRRHWDADAVRSWPRPGVGRSRAGATPEAAALLSELQSAAAGPPERQAELLAQGRELGLEISAMARALGVSRHTAYARLRAESVTRTRRDPDSRDDLPGAGVGGAGQAGRRTNMPVTPTTSANSGHTRPEL